MAQGLERGPIKNSNIMKTTMIIMVPIDQELLEAGLSPMLKYRNIITRVLPEYSPEGYYKITFRREDIEESPEQMFKDVLVYLIQSINVEFNQNRLNEKAYRMLNKYIQYTFIPELKWAMPNLDWDQVVSQIQLKYI